MRVAFIGTQLGMTPFQKEALKKHLIEFHCSEFIHGSCIGADKEANDIAIQAGIKIFTIWPSNNSKKRAFCFTELQLKELTVRIKPQFPPLVRNQYIIDSSDILIAAPKEHSFTLRSGTWATIRRGWSKIRNDKTYKVIIIPPIVAETELEEV